MLRYLEIVLEQKLYRELDAPRSAAAQDWVSQPNVRRGSKLGESYASTERKNVG